MIRPLACTTLFVLACSGPLPPVWSLDEFRILGVVSDPAETTHGSTVTMSLITADNQSRAVDAAWFLCSTPLPPFASGSDPLSGCTGEEQLAAGTTVTWQVPDAMGLVDDMGRETFTVFGFACAGGTIAPPAAGSSTPQCMGDDTDSWIFTRQMYVNTPMSLNPPNQNPHIATVQIQEAGAAEFSPLIEGTPFIVHTCANQQSHSTCPKWDFQVLFSPTSREEYTEPDPISGAITQQEERMTVGFIVTAGMLDGGFRTDTDAVPVSPMDNGWLPPATPGPVTLYLYVDDGRGGFDWTTRTLIVR